MWEAVLPLVRTERRYNMPTATKPTTITVADGAGTPGTFGGKNYRPSAPKKPTRAQKKEATGKIAQLLAQIQELQGRDTVTSPNQTKVSLPGALKQVDKLESDIKQLEAQGGDRKKAEKEIIDPASISTQDLPDWAEVKKKGQ